MTVLLVAILIAVLLGWTLLRLLRANDSSAERASPPTESAHPAFIAETVFSPRDWLFIQKEGSASLNALFVHERRIIAVAWLRDCLDAVRSVRANHLRQSRHSQDLNLPAEAKLLLRFFYLSALCRCLLLVVQFVHPAAPHAIALYIQNLASTVLPGQPPELVLSSVAVHEVSRERLR